MNKEELIEEHGEKFELLLEEGYTLEEAVERLDFFIGEYDSLEDWAIEYVESSFEIPKEILPYIDWEKFACDSAQDFEVLEGEGRFYLFGW